MLCGNRCGRCGSGESLIVTGFTGNEATQQVERAKRTFVLDQMPHIVRAGVAKRPAQRTSIVVFKAKMFSEGLERGVHRLWR